MNPLLGRPIGNLCQPVVPIGVESSLQLAAERMRDLGLPALPVSDGSRIIGALDERDLTQALSAGFEQTASVSSLPLTKLPMLFAGASGAEALRVFEDQRAPCVVVVDQQMNLVGMLTPSRLFPHIPRGIRPPLVGGMATPMGVYLTNGAQQGGVGFWALALTGLFLALVHLVALNTSNWVGIGMIRASASISVAESVSGFLSVLLFLGAIRLTPLAGYHAAEHMVVHAIERGEELHPEIVKRMPRVHPRCGTNLAAGMSLFFGIAFGNWFGDPQLQVLVAILATLFFWRPLGAFIQYWFTTRPPSRKQLEAGIFAGKDLLAKYENNPVVAPNPWQRFVSSGLPFILLGYLSLAYVVSELARVLNLRWFVGV
ncbi:MAG: DUF1385 domain-containing protein [Chthonomonas sp.]|nr:DUF1385 domain-containing protein [Chthonomonas sp.]